MTSEHLAGEPVEFSGGDSRSYGFSHRVSSFGYDASGSKKSSEVFIVIDRHIRQITARSGLRHAVSLSDV
jgi:hypothetical protein